MPRRLFFICIFLSLISVLASAADLITPPSLTYFSSSPVYSIAQDSRGALLFNTTSGPYRYNGHTLTNMGSSSSTYLSKFATSDGNTIFLNHPDGIFRYSLPSSSLSAYKAEKIAPALPENSPLLASSDSLYFAFYNTINLFCHDSLTTVVSLNEGVHIRSLKRLPCGRILVATYESQLGVVSDGIYQEHLSLNSNILQTFVSSSGHIWVGTSHDGLFELDPEDFSILARYVSPDSFPMLDVRCFAEDFYGNLYFGSASGLFKLDEGGAVSRISIDSVDTNSVCDVFVDHDGNLWVSTYDNGVYFANITSFPFTHLTADMPIGTPRGIAMTPDGTLWVATDPDGLLSLRSGVWSNVAALGRYKFQSAYYDHGTCDLFLGDWDGMVRYNPLTGEHRHILFADYISVGSRIPVFSILRYGPELYIGTPIGVFLFNPDREDIISRRLGGLSSRINSISLSPDGSLIFAGRGLYLYSRNVVNEIEAYSDFDILDLRYDASGSLWAAVSKDGILNVKDNWAYVRYNRENSGLPDVSISYVMPLPDGTVAAGTSRGISILDPLRRSCYNYDKSNGIGFKSTSRGGTFLMPDGTVLLGGNGAIEVLNPSDVPLEETHVSLSFDSLTVNEKPYAPSPSADGTLVLDHKAINLCFDIATFDYSNVERYVYSYKLEGIDTEWHEFDISESIRCMNLSPGHYRLRVRESANFESVRSEIAIPIKIMPIWFLSLPFIVFWALLIVVVLAFIFYSIYVRNNLKRRLQFEEEQNNRQRNFFLDLSLRIRTPVNLMIGQIERYFKEYGSRGRGMEDIQDVYGQATHIRGLISDFVGDSDAHPDDMQKYSKLLNAAIGVVERYLFSGNLDVPLLCKELNMGKTKLTAALKEASGLTPRELIEDIRLKHAVHMLLEGNHTVSEISDILGFSSPKYFAVRFKQKFGCPPTMYGRQ